MGLAILIIDDDERFAARLSRFLTKEGFHVEHAASGEAGVELFGARTPDVVLLDLVLPGIDGMQTLEQLKVLDASVTVVVMTAHASITGAIEAMRLGALDYVTKPVDLEALCLKLNKASQLADARSDLDYMLERDRRHGGFEDFIGDCPPMREIYERIQQVAQTDNTTVLVMGESGTGKELVARAIHGLSARRKKPLMEINCTAIPEALMESELFGHERGAFTGADRAKKGLLELADGGSLFLDEMGDMPLVLQGKLLRVLQERQFRRVGGGRDLPFDVRVIAATNQDLEKLSSESTFRSDLLYRLKVFEVELPPLRDRGDDILLIAEALVAQFSASFRKSVTGLDDKAQELLCAYRFPGNVRELRNILEQATILAKGERITADLLSIPAPTRSAASEPAAGLAALTLEALGDKPLVAAERMVIKQAMKRSGGNKKEAAKLLGISRFALQRKLEKITMELLGD